MRMHRPGYMPPAPPVEIPGALWTVCGGGERRSEGESWTWSETPVPTSLAAAAAAGPGPGAPTVLSGRDFLVSRVELAARTWDDGDRYAHPRLVLLWSWSDEHCIVRADWLPLDASRDPVLVLAHAQFSARLEAGAEDRAVVVLRGVFQLHPAPAAAKAARS